MDDNVYYGIVKIYNKDSKFGFICHEENFDIYFNNSNLQTIFNIGDIVSFKTTTSKNKRFKYDAINVKKLDENFVLEKFNKINHHTLYLYLKRLDETRKIKIISEKLVEIGKIESKESFEKSFSLIKHFKQNYTYNSDFVIPELIIELLSNLCSERYKIEFLIKKIFFVNKHIPIDFINRTFLLLDFKKQEEIFMILKMEHKIIIIENQLNLIGKLDNEESYEKSLRILDLFKKWESSKYVYYVPDQIVEKLFKFSSEENKLFFWLKNIYPKEWEIRISFISELFTSLSFDKQKDIINKLNDEQIISLYGNIISNIGKIDNDESYNKAKLIVELVKKIYKNNSYQINEVIKIQLYNYSNDKYRLLYYIDNFSPEYYNLTLELINKYIESLSEEIQISLMKKAIKEIDGLNISNYCNYLKGEDNFFCKYTNIFTLTYWHTFAILNGERIEYYIKEKRFDELNSNYYLSEIIKKFPFIDSKYLYQHIFVLIKSFKKSINNGLNYFSSKQTIKKRNEIINIKVYMPFIRSLIRKTSAEFQLQLTLDGFYDLFDEKWILDNLDNLDNNTINRILSFKNNEINSKILESKVEKLNFIESSDEYHFAINIIHDIINYDIDNYDLYLNKIKQNSKLKYQIKLWIDCYLNDLDIDLIYSYYKTTDEYEREEIFRKCKLNEKEIVFKNQLEEINIVNNQEQYKKLKTLLLLIKNTDIFVYENIDWLNLLSIGDQFLVNLWKDGFYSGLKFNEIITNHVFKNEFILNRINNLGIIHSEKSFNELNELLLFLKNNFKNEEYQNIVKNIYSEKSDYCKIKLYLYDIIQLTNDEANNDFKKIFKGQYFKLLKNEKWLFTNKAKNQLPDYNKQLLKNIGVSSHIKQNVDGTKLYYTYYNDIYYNNGYFKIKLDDEKDIYSKPKEWYFSRNAFNILQEYFSYKQQKQYLRISLNTINEIITTPELIDDLKELEKNILVVLLQKRTYVDEIKEVAKNVKEIEYKTLSNKDIKRITNEENSECVHYLFDNILENYKPIYVNEIIIGDKLVSPIANVGSWLFSIPVSNSDIAIIWESVKLDRATHIFKVNLISYEIIVRKIQDYLYSPSVNKRRKLNSSEQEDRELQIDLNYWCRIEHDWINQCENWYEKIRNLIPQMNERNS